MTICKRSVWKCILLSFLTFGFYTVYWLYLQARNVRALKHNAKSLRREMIFLLFIPFYWIYWMYESGKTIRVKLSGKSERIGSNEFLFLVLSLICPVRMTWIICLAVMQHDMNGVPAESDKPGNQYLFARDNAFSVEAICLQIEKAVASMG